MNFVEELSWRGMIHDVMPGTEELLLKELTSAYVGIDPTADSLHIGHLVGVMMLKHFQRCGHKPIALVGGATGMIGDPSMKSQERNLLDEVTLRHNQECIKKQLACFLDFESDAPNAAEMVNNYDWMKEFTFLDFIRDIGKHITVNYMISKDSVKKRLSSESSAGMSFTEFTYQLVQGYDFLYLFQHKKCKLQMGGSDQWGNITTGTELIRRMDGGEAHAITTPLLTKADGSKFGKSEGGNVWLDKARTSPYRFYQFWLNASDDDAARFLKIFTTRDRQEVEALIAEHAKAPHQRLLQREFAADVTTRVHGREELEAALQASEILFGKATAESLASLSEQQWLDVFEGVPQAAVSRDVLSAGVPIVDLLTEHGGFLASKGEARRALKENSIAVNKEKAGEERTIGTDDLLGGKFILLQRGKKNYFLVKVEG